jgi:L-alanine-DL-glutamate epimerase-like enolase superfamily enzyme
MSSHHIKSVDIIPIFPRLAARYADRVVDMYGIDSRLLCRVETDSGLVGWGDQRVRPWFVPADDMGQDLVGHDPFDFLNSDQSGGINTALYDLMGKCLEVPAWKLMGPKRRDWVPVAAWTRQAAPEQFAAEIQRAVAQGYRVFKMHTCSHHDVFEQTRAAEAVAPDGFKIHYDFNHGRSLGAVLPVVAELERNHPIVAWIEDPLIRYDIEGWRALRQKTRIPIIMHGTPMGGMQEYKHDMADAYMIGGSMFDTMSAGFALGRANLQVILQHESGTLGKAMAMHMAAVLPTHTAHSINLDDQYEEDVTTQRIPVVDGSSPVPEGIGVGYEVDESAVQRLSQQKLVEPPRHIGILHMSDNSTWYGKGYVSPRTVTGTEEAGLRGFRSELWEDDGTSEFEAMFARVEKEGTVRAS